MSEPRQSLGRTIALGLVLLSLGVLGTAAYSLWRLHQDSVENGLNLAALDAGIRAAAQTVAG